MRIAVLGAGRVGRALGARLDSVGHEVVYGVRRPKDPGRSELGIVAAPADAVAGADVVLLALPWNAVEDVLREVQVGDAVVVDATNPLGAVEAGTSGAELVARWAGSGRVVKAFNTTGWETMADPSYPLGTPLLPVAGDDDGAKAIAVSLATEIGFDAVDAGPLSSARQLESLAALWIGLSRTLGRTIAFALLRREEPAPT